MKTIELTQGYVTLVDDEDFEQLNQFNWHASVQRNNVYAVRNRNIIMHREIMHPPKDKQIDHIDGRGLNNLRSNLRICTNQQNSFNRKSMKKATSKYIGVYWDKDHKKWRSQIKIHGRARNIGLFSREIKAAIARDKVALEYFGDFAKLNILKRI